MSGGCCDLMLQFQSSACILDRDFDRHVISDTAATAVSYAVHMQSQITKVIPATEMVADWSHGLIAPVLTAGCLNSVSKRDK